MAGVSNIAYIYGLEFRSETSLGGSHIVYITENLAPTCAECDFCDIHNSQPVQVDRLVSYPHFFIYLSYYCLLSRELKTNLGLSQSAVSCYLRQ